jgi:hypothetical protein
LKGSRRLRAEHSKATNEAAGLHRIERAVTPFNDAPALRMATVVAL